MTLPLLNATSLTEPTASKTASAKSISWAAATWPPISPTNPPVPSTAVDAATWDAPFFKGVNAVLPTAVAAPFDKPRVIPSIAPIAIPLPKALEFNFAALSLSDNKALIFSSLNSLSPSSSFISSVNTNPVSIAAVKPPQAPATPPVAAPPAPPAK